MCNCLQDIANKMSEENNRNGRNALVRIEGLGTYTRTYVKAKTGWDGSGKEIRLSSRGSTGTIGLAYCPICGEKCSNKLSGFITAGK